MVLFSFNSLPLCFVAPEAIPLMVRVIQSADSRVKENVNATENCISAVGKVMRFRPECVNVNEILPHWLNWLPLLEDKEEAVHTFDFLCDLIERYGACVGKERHLKLFSKPFVVQTRFCFFPRSNNPIVLGPDNANLPRVFLIIADGVANESVKTEDACSKRMADVIRQVQVNSRFKNKRLTCIVRDFPRLIWLHLVPQGSGGLWTQCVSTLNETQQKAIQELLNTA